MPASVTNSQPGSGYRLPREAYFDPAWLEHERRELFPSTWNFACSKAEVARPGSYVCTSVGHYPIVVVRGADDRVRAFHNICRHRGAQLLTGEGRCERIVCPYHRWQYDLAGRLTNVPQRQSQLPLLQEAEWGLKPVAAGEWMGLVFVNPDGTAPALETWLAGVPETLNAYRLEELDELERCAYTLPANWKFYVENHIDWYHLWYTHARSLPMLDHRKGRWFQTGPHWLSFDPFKPDARNREAFTPLDGLPAELRSVGAHLLFPNLPLFSGGSWFGTGHLIPVTPEETLMSFRLWALPGQDPAAFLERFRSITQGEDAAVAARLQATVRSPAFEVGPLTRDYEAPIAAFHEHYLSLLEKG